MKLPPSVAFIAFALAALTEPLAGQTRGPANRSHNPTAERHVGSRSVPAVPPSGSTRIFPTTPLGAGRRPLLFRSSLFGLVAFDPYWWWAPTVGDGYARPLLPLAADHRPTGGLQLDVEPRRALVYVDGLYVGLVDDFSGYYHHLEAGAGPHLVEIIAPDYEPLIVDINVSPGQTTTYRGVLSRGLGRY